MAMKSINPATGEVNSVHETISDRDVAAKIEVADQAFAAWRKISVNERKEHANNIAQELSDNVEEYAQLLTKEMGKPIGEARAEVKKCAWNFEHYAENIDEYLAPRVIETDASESYVSYEPLGVILIIMPWNFPLWQVLRMAAPIMLAGNTIVLKHASNVPETAIALEELMNKAGLPKGVFQSLLIGSSQVEQVIENDAIKGVSLTGSEKAGSIVGSQAGKAIKPVVLELGGSDPSIVLADADIQLACDAAAQSRLLNNGQSCIGSKRFVVVDDVYDDFVEKMKAIFEAQVLGDPMNEKTTIGPVVSEHALEELLDQIHRSKKAGAKVLVGGNRKGETGYYLEPTILVDIDENMPTYHEEVFGPVASIIKVKDEEEAIKVANATRFGLGASLYTSDLDKAKELIPKIEAGAVFVNGLVKSDPRLPFGGIKKSGIGRELSAEGARAFTNAKTVWIK